ncbi:kinase [Micromonospora sp. NPDC051296]|uniref:GHMP family kinase ATP-binding protein n=1 Tax=Micromonospora sp. NPDC051296 TaxID=3155046 RepID=UPI0034395AFB
MSMTRTSGLLLPKPRYRGATGVGAAYGTFGELLQGRLPEDDGDFLVTFPVARWSVATFRTDPGVTGVKVWPPHKRKGARLAEMIIAETGERIGAHLSLDSGLPEGKGMASSSADLVATARAVGNALGVDMPPERIESHLREIEPTDGVLYPGIVAYHHRQVRLRAMLGALPSMTVVGVDEGGEVDTVAFNQLPKPFSAADRREYAWLLARMADAVRARDLAEVGRIATRSAEMNQILRPFTMLSDMVDVCERVGGLGVVAAHSGTMLGILLDRARPDYHDTLAATASACAALAGNVAVYQSLSFDFGS